MTLEYQSGEYSIRIVERNDGIAIYCRNIVTHRIYRSKSNNYSVVGGNVQNFNKILLSPHAVFTLFRDANKQFVIEVKYDFDGFSFNFTIGIIEMGTNEIDTKQFDKYLQTITSKINAEIAYFGGVTSCETIIFKDYEFGDVIEDMKEKFLEITNIPICQAKHYGCLEKYYNFYHLLSNTINQHEESGAIYNILLEKSTQIKRAVILTIANHPALNNDTLMRKLLSQKSLPQIIEDLKTEISKSIVEQMQDKTFIYNYPEFVFGNELEVYVKIGKRNIEWNQSNYVEYMQKIIDERFNSSEIVDKLSMYENVNANEEPSIDLGKYRDIMKLYNFIGDNHNSAEFNMLKYVNENFTKKRITELFLNKNNNKIELCCAEGGVYTPEQKFVIDALDGFYDI